MIAAFLFVVICFFVFALLGTIVMMDGFNQARKRPTVLSRAVSGRGLCPGPRGCVVPGDDLIGRSTERPLWTELDDYQLRRLLDGPPATSEQEPPLETKQDP